MYVCNFVNGESSEQVYEFIYFVSIFVRNGKADKDIEKRMHAWKYVNT